MSKGGNAVDAAIATMLCDGVLCPEYLGIGGGFLMSIYNATTKKVITINARETAPAAASTSMFVTNPEKSIYGTYQGSKGSIVNFIFNFLLNICVISENSEFYKYG